MNADEQLPDKVLTSLSGLEAHDGFKMYQHAFEEKKNQIISQILDTGVGDQETHDLKQQLEILERLTPLKTTKKMRVKAGNRIKDYKIT